VKGVYLKKERSLFGLHSINIWNFIGVINLNNFQDKVNFIWSIAELLRGPYKKEQYGDVILPMAVLRRFDCVLAETKQEVLKKYEELKEIRATKHRPCFK
jgi:hypothetical protein